MVWRDIKLYTAWSTRNVIIIRGIHAAPTEPASHGVRINSWRMPVLQQMNMMKKWVFSSLYICRRTGTQPTPKLWQQMHLGSIVITHFKMRIWYYLLLRSLCWDGFHCCRRWQWHRAKYNLYPSYVIFIQSALYSNPHAPSSTKLANQ